MRDHGAGGFLSDQFEPAAKPLGSIPVALTAFSPLPFRLLRFRFHILLQLRFLFLW